MNSVGMNTKITMYPKTVHFVREYQYCSFPEWDEEIQKNIRWQIGREWIILKANGRTRKFKKYLDDDRTEADIDKTAVSYTHLIQDDSLSDGQIRDKYEKAARDIMGYCKERLSSGYSAHQITEFLKSKYERGKIE